MFSTTQQEMAPLYLILESYARASAQCVTNSETVFVNSISYSNRNKIIKESRLLYGYTIKGFIEE